MIYACDYDCDVFERHSWRLPVDLVAVAHLDCLWDTCVNSSKEDPARMLYKSEIIQYCDFNVFKELMAFASRPGCCGAPGETKPLTHLCQLFKERWKTKLGILFIWKILSPLFKERSRTKLVGIVFAWMENSVCKLLWRPNLPNFCVSSSKND